MLKQQEVYDAIKEEFDEFFDGSLITEDGVLRFVYGVPNQEDATVLLEISLNMPGEETDDYPYLIHMFTTIAQNVDVDDMVILNAKMNELSRYIAYGNFGVFMEYSQLYHRYTFAAKDSVENIIDSLSIYMPVVLQIVLNLYPLLMILVVDPLAVDLEEAIGNGEKVSEKLEE